MQEKACHMRELKTPNQLTPGGRLHMTTQRQVMPGVKRIALIAHNGRKLEMLEWASWNRQILARHELYATGTTGALLANELELPVTRFRSGPLGGDQQVGAAITEGKIDLLIFFWEPLEPHPHDVDVKALLRIATVYNIPVACNRASADFTISSPLMSDDYERMIIDDFVEHSDRSPELN
jgi:methylglyoxal synthase